MQNKNNISLFLGVIKQSKHQIGAEQALWLKFTR